jgi:hypothetical protein
MKNHTNESDKNNSTKKMINLFAEFKPQLHADGISIGRWGWRLGNIAPNLSWFTVSGAMALLSYLPGALGEEKRRQFLQHPDGTIIYQVEFESNNEFNNLCNALTHPNINYNAMSRHFDIISTWPGMGLLRRGRGRHPDPDFEACLKTMLDVQYENFKPTYSPASSNSNNTTIFLLVTWLIVIPILLLLLWRAHRAQPQEIQMPQKGNLFKPNKPISISESLAKKISEDDEKVPKKFLDPVYHSLMTDPVIIDDGHTYDYSTVELLIKNSLPCPQNPSKKIQTIVTNYFVKKEISNWVDEEERKYKENCKNEVDSDQSPKNYP